MINNTLSPTSVPYDTALANLKKGLTGNSLTQATASLQNAYKQTPAPVATKLPATVTSVNRGDSKPVKGLVSPTYSGLVGSLAKASAPSTIQTGLIQKNIKAAEGNTGIGQQAQQIADTYAPEIGRVGQLGAAAQAGYGSTGSNIVGAGNAAIASQNASARMSALSQAEQAQLAGNAQQLTAQGQLQSGYGTALGGANTQQSQQLSGLGAAAGLAQPQTAAFGQTTFNPLTGEYSGNSGLPQEVLQQYASLAANGQYAAIPSSITGNPVLSAQLNALASQMNPNYTPVASQAQGNVLSSNIQALGTAQAAGQAQGIQAQAAAPGLGAAAGTQAVNAVPGQTQADQYTQIANYKSAAQQGEQLASQLNDLLTQFNLNPSDLNAVNSGIQKIASNTSDPRYQILSNYLNDVASRYAQVLTPPGGSATDMTRSIAKSMLDATASGKSIQQVLASLGQQAQAVISAVPASGTVPGANSQYQNGQSVGAGGFEFVFQNGKWVPK